MTLRQGRDSAVPRQVAIVSFSSRSLQGIEAMRCSVCCAKRFAGKGLCVLCEDHLCTEPGAFVLNEGAVCECALAQWGEVATKAVAT